MKVTTNKIDVVMYMYMYMYMYLHVSCIMWFKPHFSIDWNHYSNWLIYFITIMESKRTNVKSQSLSDRSTCYIVADLSLILQIFPDFSGGKVPHFNKPISATCHKILSIWRKYTRLWIRFGAKLNSLIQNCRIFLLFYVSYSSPTPSINYR